MKKISIGPRTLLYPHPDLIIGTYGPGDRPDAMVAAWGGICSSQPPAVAVSVQKVRQTYENLTSGARVHGQHTVGGLREGGSRLLRYRLGQGYGQVRRYRAHAREGRPRERAVMSGSSRSSLECRLLQTVEIGMHTQFIGEILDVKVDESVLGPDGKPDIGKDPAVRLRLDAAGSTYGFGRCDRKGRSLWGERSKSNFLVPNVPLFFRGTAVLQRPLPLPDQGSSPPAVPLYLRPTASSSRTAHTAAPLDDV